MDDSDDTVLDLWENNREDPIKLAYAIHSFVDALKMLVDNVNTRVSCMREHIEERCREMIRNLQTELIDDSNHFGGDLKNVLREDENDFIHELRQALRAECLAATDAVVKWLEEANTVQKEWEQICVSVALIGANSVTDLEEKQKRAKELWQNIPDIDRVGKSLEETLTETFRGVAAHFQWRNMAALNARLESMD